MTIPDRDDRQRIAEAVADAGARVDSGAAAGALRVCGEGSKALRFATAGLDMPASTGAQRLSTLDHHGLLHYAPDELVLEARSGTPLRDVEALLAQNDQVLPFEPPRLGGRGTLGGAVAAGLSGPARPWRGSVRDAVLGVELVNGRGEILRLGGRVVKNVAGYDLSRLQAGACGSFGVLLSVAVRVLPAPTMTLTVHQQHDLEPALALLATLPARALRLTGAAGLAGVVSLRLAGAPRAVSTAARELGGEHAEGDHLWTALRDQTHSFFSAGAVRWRASLPLASGAMPGDAQALIEWGGAQRWYRAAEDAVTPPAELVAAVVAAGGRLEDARRPSWCQVDGPRAQLQARLREAFDPAGLFVTEAG
ncbi:MAG: glycolate oxidase subunit GlcE [Pseudomonadota bacterium]